MNKIVRNILAAITGIVIGSMVNMGIITVQDSFIALPEGVDVNNPKSLQSSMHLFEPKHFIFPFLAHAIGTLVGAYLSVRIAASHKMYFAFGIGVFFLIGGISMVFMIPAPVWFIVADLSLAYIPMSWLGWKLSRGKTYINSYPTLVGFIVWWIMGRFRDEPVKRERKYSSLYGN